MLASLPVPLFLGSQLEPGWEEGRFVGSLSVLKGFVHVKELLVLLSAVL